MASPLQNSKGPVGEAPPHSSDEASSSLLRGPRFLQRRIAAQTQPSALPGALSVPLPKPEVHGLRHFRHYCGREERSIYGHRPVSRRYHATTVAPLPRYDKRHIRASMVDSGVGTPHQSNPTVPALRPRPRRRRGRPARCACPSGLSLTTFRRKIPLWWNDVKRPAKSKVRRDDLGRA